MKKLLTILIILTVLFVSDIPSVVEAQSRNDNPSPEQPRAEEKKDDTSRTKRSEKKKASPTPSQSSTTSPIPTTTTLFQIIVKRVFSIIPDVTSSPTPRPSVASQPQGEQPRAEEKKDDTSRTKRSEKKKASPTPSPTTEQGSTQTTPFLGGFVERIFSTISSVVSNVVSTPAPTPSPSSTPRVDEEEQRRQEEFMKRLRERRAEQPGSDDELGSRRSTPTPISSPSPSPILTPTSTSTPTQTPISVGKIKKTNLQYPIKELGNCKKEADCKKYCDLKENVKKCAEFGQKTGLMTAQEAETAEAIANISDGPGGCTDQESCAKVCDDSANTSACLEYAKKNKLMIDDELEKAKKVAGIISSGSKTPGGCKTPKDCQQYCTGGAHVDECIKFAKEAGLISGDEGNKMEKGKDFLQNGGPGGCKSKEECEAYCDKDDHFQECEAFFNKAGVPDRKAKDNSGKPPKTGGGAVCNTQEECEAFCKNPANAESCKNVVMKGGKKSGPETTGDMGKMLGDINKMPPESRECLKQALGAETFDKLMRGEQPETPISGDIQQSCFAKGVEEYEQKAMPTKKPDDFSTEYGPGPGYRYNSAGEVEEVPYGTPVYPGGVPEVQGATMKPSLLDMILDWIRR